MLFIPQSCILLSLSGATVIVICPTPRRAFLVSEGSGEIAHMLNLARGFTERIRDKYPFRMTWLMDWYLPGKHAG